ncbi:MAG: sulfotransferase domain-containing protein [Phycisphaerales bacterium]
MAIQMLLQRGANIGTRQIAARFARDLSMYPVVEFPKCGGTWLCRMLSGCMDLPFAQFSRLPVAMPCVVHSHWKYHPKMRNVTYLMRDGRDVIVSFYFHATRPNKVPNNADPEKMVRVMRELFGNDADLDDVRSNLPRFIEYIFKNPYGSRLSWSEHMSQWLDREDVVYTRYEDLRTNCASSMLDLLGRHGVQVTHERVTEVVERFSMQRMTGRKPGQEDTHSFIRKGIVGDWVNHFSRESAELFDTLAGDMLIRSGYETDRSWIERCE